MDLERGRLERRKERKTHIGRKIDRDVPVDGGEEMDHRRSRWFHFHRQYTREEKRLLLSKVVLVALETVLSNHIYHIQTTRRK